MNTPFFESSRIMRCIIRNHRKKKPNGMSLFEYAQNMMYIWTNRQRSSEAKCHCVCIDNLNRANRARRNKRYALARAYITDARIFKEHAPFDSVIRGTKNEQN